MGIPCELSLMIRRRNDTPERGATVKTRQPACFYFRAAKIGSLPYEGW